ncbi:DoxX-like family protein [Amycolatopsis thermoflava]|uniref:DoxX-like protein n=1 Tax=Amycolatopsis thermoflava TaxID=84480 RepID=A0A3N2GRE2_9PSEU|nr:DoxX-like family protein [Amycolatopsis thermoflava]ROS39103.1 DoxX-like protein [Amycolatopsis thermoflava]
MRVGEWAARWVPPGAVAAVWVYEGLVAKVLGARPDERAIVESVPVLGGAAAVVLVLIGLAEIALGGWVLTGWAPRTAAAVQTALLAGFNAGGLAFGGGHIAEPLNLVLHNVVLLVLAWLVALRRHR